METTTTYKEESSSTASTNDDDHHHRHDVTAKRASSSVVPIFRRAFKSAIGTAGRSGLNGAFAGIIQVISLMWLRTVMNYQFRYGTSFLQTIHILYNQGGIARFYSGIAFALVQAPLSRFVATAANDGVEVLLGNLNCSRSWGAGRGTAVASLVVGLCRILLMPVDTCKTVLQVEFVRGFTLLMNQVRRGKIYLLYEGAMANALYAMLSYYPWFYTYRVLQNSLCIQQQKKCITNTLLKNALIGFISSLVSDTLMNPLHVIKTSKQAIAASNQNVGYGEIINIILTEDGFKGFFGRGIQTKILCNALQSVLFTVIWRELTESRERRSAGAANTTTTMKMVDEEGFPLLDERI